jgi:thioredoxin-related protein
MKKGMVMHLLQRSKILCLLVALCCGSVALAKDLPEPEMTDDGLYTQPWFLNNSFLDLKEDHAEALQQGKTLVILWELRGCPYCKVLHTTNLVRPEILKLARDKFVVLQLNYLGGRPVIDFDGEEISEKKLAKKHGVRFTPTIQFFGPKVSAKKGAKNEVYRMAGYYKPFHFLALLEYVSRSEYKNKPFRKYLVAKAKAMQAKGIDVNAW